jgi:hypothetical protein
MGLPAVWIEIAREIGYSSFMAVWRILDRSEALRSDSDSMIEVKLRRYGSFRRFQRNLFIESLVAAGLGVREIRTTVAATLGESLSKSQIHRLATRLRVRE